MPNIVISGCGNIGSRLLQSVSNIEDAEIGALDIYGIDPFQSSLDLSTERFGQENKGGHTLHMSTSPTVLPPEADLLIVSVDAANRLNALTSVVEHCKPKTIILEKILFNEFEHFDAAQKTIDNLGVPCWVNCSRNVWPGYGSLKSTLAGAPVSSYTVTGSDWGLGCNAIHFLAAFEYISGATLSSLSIETESANVRESKRAGYKEVTGTLHGTTDTGAAISLTSSATEGDPIKVVVTQGDDEYVIAEGKTISKNGGEPQPFPMLYASQLTEPFTQILKNGQSDLPDYAASTRQHKFLFQALNEVFYGKFNSETQCPVT